MNKALRVTHQNGLVEALKPGGIFKLSKRPEALELQKDGSHRRVSKKARGKHRRMARQLLKAGQ